MKLKSTFSFSDDIILRVPALPFRSEISDDEAVDLINCEYFMEALFLASPILYEQAKKLPELGTANPKRTKIIHSITKYFLRMSSRSTPFGLFSGCSTTKWIQKEDPVLLGKPSRSTRLDMQYLCDLIRKLGASKELRKQLLYFPNTSYYRIGKEIRYSEFEFIHGLRQHHLSSTECSEYLDIVLLHAQGGCLFSSLMSVLEREGIDQPDAFDYLNEIIDSQLLVSEMEPKITGIEYVHQLIGILKKCLGKSSSPYISFLLTTLLKINELLKELDVEFNNSEEKYQHLIQLIRTLKIDFDENKLFQTDLIHNVISGGLNASIQPELLESVDILSRICSPSKRHKMSGFAKAFTERYDMQEVPLLQVLDPENAIGYGVNKNQHISPLTERIQLDNTPNGNRSTQISWDPVQQWLLSKLLTATKNNDYEVDINLEEVSNFKSHLSDFPSSTSVVFKKVAHSHFDTCIEGVGGTSAANLLGRFGHASSEINDCIKSIIDHETQSNPDVVFCEIVHLPESRVGNILLRPACHEYEIPYLAQASKPEEYTVNLDDIMVSVIDGVVYLRSRKLNKRIVPRLTSAHNSSFRTLPIYEFLCDIQTQEQCVGTYFNWGNLSIEFSFLPRLTYKRTILFLATWGLNPAELSHLYHLDGKPLSKAVNELREKWNLPQSVMLIDRDNELLINLNNILSIKTLLSTVLKKDKIVLREYLMPAAADVLKDDKGNVYANQFVASLLHHKEVYKSKNTLRFINHPDEKVTRTYSFGSEWFYYKIYCGINTGDRILSELAPLLERLQQEGLVDKYFFIRFDDPKPHLRIRLHLTNADNSINKVSKIVDGYLNTTETRAHIDQVQIGAYVRELERYGSKNISQVESVFHIDSEASLHFLKDAFDHTISTLRWMYALKSIDTILTDFGLNTTDKIYFLKPLTNAFSDEFSVDKQGKINIDKAYRELRSDVEKALNLDGSVDEYRLDSLESILSDRSRKILPFVLHLKEVNSSTELNHIMISIIHMTINRVMNTNTRQNEFLIYNHLLKAYISRDAIEKKVSLVK